MIIRGDSLEELKKLDADSVDAVVTDPPYGLSFMGKKWDYEIPSIDLWREVVRVLKPGGHILSFSGTRTYHRMVVNLEEAGAEIRDQIQWIYGSGFPKSLNLGNGFGTALKPANEPIVLARKPLSESTVAKNVLKHGTGALNIDGSRIEGTKRSPEFKDPKSELGYHGGSANKNLVNWDATKGRWPANVLFDEEAAAMLDAQSGVLKNGGKANDKNRVGMFGKRLDGNQNDYIGDSGGASRFFYCAKSSKSERNAGLEGMPEKAPPGSKRSTPAEGRTSALGAPRANHHPTVKPIKLMEYLCTLITPPGGVILDPFCGSGSTGVAAINLGFKFIGIEREAEYCEIAEKRIAHASKTDEQLELEATV